MGERGVIMLQNTRTIRRYPKGKYKSVGEFITKIGGYKYYYKWLRDNPVKANKRIGRNEKCPCDSGKKYKKCCL